MTHHEERLSLVGHFYEGGPGKLFYNAKTIKPSLSFRIAVRRRDHANFTSSRRAEVISIKPAFSGRVASMCGGLTDMSSFIFKLRSIKPFKFSYGAFNSFADLWAGSTN